MGVLEGEKSQFSKGPNVWAYGKYEQNRDVMYMACKINTETMPLCPSRFELDFWTTDPAREMSDNTSVFQDETSRPTLSQLSSSQICRSTTFM